MPIYLSCLPHLSAWRSAINIISRDYCPNVRVDWTWVRQSCTCPVDRLRKMDTLSRRAPSDTKNACGYRVSSLTPSWTQRVEGRVTSVNIPPPPRVPLSLHVFSISVPFKKKVVRFHSNEDKTGRTLLAQLLGFLRSVSRRAPISLG
jgi:hypothetical protein